MYRLLRIEQVLSQGKVISDTETIVEEFCDLSQALLKRDALGKEHTIDNHNYRRYYCVVEKD